MTRLYPHTNTITIAVVCALVVTGFVAYVRSHSDAEISTSTAPVVTARTSTSNDTLIALDDSIDWKKALLSVASTSGSSEISSSEPLTLTDVLGRDFFERYMQLRQQNLSSDSVAVENSVESTLEDIVQHAPVPVAYSSADIVASSNNDAGSMRIYGNSVATAFITHAPRTNPLEIVTSALEDEDMDILEDLDPVIVSYENLIRALISIPTPSSIQNIHIELINNLSALGFINQQFRNVSTDPMQSMIALGTYADAERSLRSTLLNLKDHFDTHNIAFTSTEPGTTFATISANP
ncbi:MAG: hypothetical protein AAB381_01505 [Patescibacteria group bacterium]